MKHYRLTLPYTRPARTVRVRFRTARNGTGVMCYLPDGKAAFPSRYYGADGQQPQAGERWEVAVCDGGYPTVAYVKPLRRLAAAGAPAAPVRVWQTLRRLFTRT